MKQTIVGRDERDHLLTGLLPDTNYEIAMVSFNGAGESEFSNKAVRSTLGKPTKHSTKRHCSVCYDII